MTKQKSEKAGDASMNTVVRVAISDTNRYFSIGLQEVLTRYFNTHGKRTQFIDIQCSKEADLVFHYFPHGVPSCFCHLADARSIEKKILYFSLRDPEKRCYSPNIVRCLMESGVIYHDMSLVAILHQVSSNLNLDLECKRFDKIRYNVNCICRSHHLTPRENQILRLIFQEMTIKQIAKILAINIKTVSNHKMSVMRKMGFRRNAELYTWLRYYYLRDISLP
ncbi:TPA: LuxR C-terminal-related transcriptional regulator [Serratia marcescens]